MYHPDPGIMRYENCRQTRGSKHRCVGNNDCASTSAHV